MYTKYVEILAKHATHIFQEMTGTEVLSYKVKIDERVGDSIPLAHTVSYEHMEKSVQGQFVLGFANQAMATAVASALAEKMGLPPLGELDEIAADLLNEFMNTIVGRTISDWDRLGMPVRFSPPTVHMFSTVKMDEKMNTQAYVVILGLTFSHIILRVTFNETYPAHHEARRVLVVEDSAVIRNIIARTLQQFGYEVAPAENGRRAAALYQTFRPHLVLMDLVMPQMGGLEAMEAIRAFDPKARFIVLTSSARKDEVLTARKIGVMAYLIKPFNPDLLMREVNKAFGVGT
ncbi:MAG: response regulator [Thermodesulfobacteriota bacterium]